MVDPFDQSNQKVRDQININNPGALIGGGVVLGIVGIVVFAIVTVTHRPPEAGSSGTAPQVQASVSAPPSSPGPGSTQPPSPDAKSSPSSPVAPPAAGPSHTPAAVRPSPACGSDNPIEVGSAVTQRVCYQRDGDKIYMVVGVSAPASTRVDVYLWLTSGSGSAYVYPANRPQTWKGILVGPDTQEFKWPVDMPLTPKVSYGVHASTKIAGDTAPNAVGNPKVTGNSMPFTY
ncbi:hypothetical protein OHS33_18990 [Streptomyces sp. NBC_00536]|uniref:hypothetical protein n=1 Tax=Streptomyces sp. NBC_00536 TaxID=2975769 RepID=UPI002E7FB76D|nr:hypothetical protein [Streptomyces sp. NBC_00536]WUC80246.1 hypothetical protein OHS33_18990 [Streptomyces sp. NBC_00536]